MQVSERTVFLHIPEYNSQTFQGGIDDLGFEVVICAVEQVFFEKLWTMGNRIFRVIKSTEGEPHHLMCLLLFKVD